MLFNLGDGAHFPAACALFGTNEKSKESEATATKKRCLRRLRLLDKLTSPQIRLQPWYCLSIEPLIHWWKCSRIAREAHAQFGIVTWILGTTPKQKGSPWAAF